MYFVLRFPPKISLKTNEKTIEKDPKYALKSHHSPRGLLPLMFHVLSEGSFSVGCMSDSQPTELLFCGSAPYPTPTEPLPVQSHPMRQPML